MGDGYLVMGYGLWVMGDWFLYTETATEN